MGMSAMGKGAIRGPRQGMKLATLSSIKPSAGGPQVSMEHIAPNKPVSQMPHIRFGGRMTMSYHCPDSSGATESASFVFADDRRVARH